MSLAHFEELKDKVLLDVKAEVLMNDIPKELIFNIGQTGIQLVPTGQWTMHQAKTKVVPPAQMTNNR